ncbi:MAG: hypothetical protein F6K15_20090 [Okeania sp. SIO2B3]|nr:hypothetical protein [Okeania sp. SIO2B3]
MVTQIIFGFSTLKITDSNVSAGKLSANSSILISVSGWDFCLTITFSYGMLRKRFFAIPPRYFNFLSSSFFRNIVLLP